MFDVFTLRNYELILVLSNLLIYSNVSPLSPCLSWLVWFFVPTDMYQPQLLLHILLISLNCHCTFYLSTSTDKFFLLTFFNCHFYIQAIVLNLHMLLFNTMTNCDIQLTELTCFDLSMFALSTVYVSNCQQNVCWWNIISDKYWHIAF